VSDVMRARPTRAAGMTASARRRALLAGVPAVVLLMALSGCTSKSGTADQSPVAGVGPGHASGGPGSAASATPAVPLAVIRTAPARTASVNPIEPVTVAVTHGKLMSVTLSRVGRVVSGALAADGTSWRNTESLGYSRTYTLSAVAVDGAGRHTRKKSTFTTLTPGDVTMPYLQRAGGYSLDNGSVYGVGIVPVVHFGQPIPDRRAAEKALTVTTRPHVDGVWNWTDDQTAHWRPRSYFAPGTKVTVTAALYGVKVGPDLYGESNKSMSFTIGPKHVAIADDNTHLVKVYFGTRLVRTMPTSMGRGGWVRATDHMVQFWTNQGIYTVLAHENPATMSSASYGLPADAPGGYAPEKIPFATKISVTGVYLHEMDSTVWAQGRTNVSHGCLNMNRDNAIWYYQNSRIGDVVKVIHTGGPKLEPWQNGDWGVPWSTWVKGSALH
jgi:lipoprotein-anchoring transpeptidase ErfK/SrfK